jgi:hypothetical protein
MFCTRCGANVPAGHPQCTACGTLMPQYATTPPPPQPYAAAPYPYAPYVQTMPYEPFPVHRTVGNGFSITGIVLGGIALLIFPIITGPAGIVFAAVGKSRGESRSTLALIIAIAGMIIGMVVGAVIGIRSL